MSDQRPNGGGRALRDRAHWEGLTARQLDKSIRSVRRIVAEHQAQVDDAQGFLDHLQAIRATKRRRPRP